MELGGLSPSAGDFGGRAIVGPPPPPYYRQGRTFQKLSHLGGEGMNFFVRKVGINLKGEGGVVDV